jgi:hypothetical protein
MNTFDSVRIGANNGIVGSVKMSVTGIKNESMEKQASFFEPLIERATEYGKTSVELYKLKAIEKTSDVASTMVSRMLALMALGLFMLMISVGAAFWLGEILGKVYYGFLCVGGFYGVLGLVLYFILHKWVKERTSDAIITRILN